MQQLHQLQSASVGSEGITRVFVGDDNQLFRDVRVHFDFQSRGGGGGSRGSGGGGRGVGAGNLGGIDRVGGLRRRRFVRPELRYEDELPKHQRDQAGSDYQD